MSASASNEGAYAEAVGATGKAPELLRARLSGGRAASTSVADWVSEYAALAARHAAELEKYLSRHQLAESQLGTLAQPWQAVADVAVAKVSALSELSRRISKETEQPVRQAVQWPQTERQLHLLEETPDDNATIDRLQSLDQARLQALKDGLTRLTTAEVDTAQQVTAAAERALQALLSFEPSEDVQSYVAQVVSGVAPVAPVPATGPSSPKPTRKVSQSALTGPPTTNTPSSSGNGGLFRSSTLRKASRASLRAPSAPHQEDTASTNSASNERKGSGVNLRAKVGSIFGRKKKPKQSSPGPQSQPRETMAAKPSAFGSGSNTDLRLPSVTRTQPPDFGLLGNSRSSSPARQPKPPQLNSGNGSSGHLATNSDYNVGVNNQTQPPTSSHRTAPAPPPSRHSIVGNLPSDLVPPNIPQQSLHRQSSINSGQLGSQPATPTGREESPFYFAQQATPGASPGMPGLVPALNLPAGVQGLSSPGPVQGLSSPGGPVQGLNSQSSLPPQDLRRSGSRSGRVSTLFTGAQATPPESPPHQQPIATQPAQQPAQQPLVSGHQSTSSRRIGSNHSQRAGSASPTTPTTGGRPEEQFYTPAQGFAPMFESANGSLASIASSSVVSTPVVSQSGLPPLPTDNGLVASILEIIDAEYSPSGELQNARGTGEVHVKFTGPPPPLPSVVLGALGSAATDFSAVAPFIRQLSANSFEVPVESVKDHSADAIRYSLIDAHRAVPLTLTPVWRIEARKARLILSCTLSEAWQGPDTVELNGLVVIVSIKGGPATSAQSKPMATFSRERQRVTWRLKEPVVLRRGSDVRILCQFSTEAAAEPASINAKFQLTAHAPAVGLQVLDGQANTWQPVRTAGGAALTLHV